MTERQRPTPEQMEEALRNECVILREAYRLQGEELSASKLETTRWRMTSDAQIKIISELRAAADPKIISQVSVMKARIAELEEALAPASAIGKPTPLTDVTPASPVPAGAGMLDG